MLYGAASGSAAAGDQQWSQGTTGIAGDDEPDDRFGTALTAGNFDAAGGDDLAVGAPWDSVAGIAEVGTVNVLYGTGGGLDDVNDEFWHQNRPNVAGGNERLDRFGDALASGDFDRDGRSDLVAGISGESVAGIGDIGAVDVLYGTGGGLTGAGSQFWHQNSPGILGGGEKFDRLSGRLRSDGVYRIAYADGTRVAVSGDRLTHSPQERIDMHGVGGFPVYLIVAARSGTIEKIVDEQCGADEQQQLRVDQPLRRRVVEVHPLRHRLSTQQSLRGRPRECGHVPRDGGRCRAGQRGAPPLRDRRPRRSSRSDRLRRVHQGRES